MSGVAEEQMKYRRIINDKVTGRPNYLREFWNDIEDTTIKTQNQYIQFIINFMDYTGKQPEDLTYVDYSGYMAKIKYKENGEEASSSHRIAVYSALKRFAKFLKKSGRATVNHMEDVNKPKYTESQATLMKRENGYLTQKQMKKLIKEPFSEEYYYDREVAECWKIRDQAIIALFLTTGMRVNALRMIDLDEFVGNKIIVREKREKNREYVLAPQIVDILNQWLEARKDISGIETDALFISNRRGRISRAVLSNLVDKYTGDIEGKHLSPHKLRATYATMLYEETKDIVYVQKCMGHSNIETTKRYIRGFDEKTKEAGNIMSKKLGL